MLISLNTYLQDLFKLMHIALDFISLLYFINSAYFAAQVVFA